MTGHVSPILSRLRAWMELMRPANIVTAFADILAGFAIAGGAIQFSEAPLSVSPEGIGWLLLSTFGLYGGGIVFNDFFDAETDASERPERPIPSGRVPRLEAGILGSLLLLFGIGSAFQVNVISGYVASGIALFALFYDVIAKRHPVPGPLVMGLCRGGNLLLGISIAPGILAEFWLIGGIPVIYISAVTLVSRGEVHGGNRFSGILSLVMLAVVYASFLWMFVYTERFGGGLVIMVLLLHMGLVLPVFIKATRKPDPEIIQRAVKTGVLTLIVLNAVFAAGFSGFIGTAVILLLLPVSVGLGRVFAVT